MEKNQLIHPNHHGFRAAHSTTTGLIQMYDSWVEALEYKQFTGVCFLDISAAFDILDHPLLLYKLQLYGFADDSLNWMRSYLNGRSQTVYIVKDFTSSNRCTTRVNTWSTAIHNLYK